MALPNFIGIGAQRAATTWLHKCLSEHPEVFVSEQKELNFFDHHFGEGLPWYERPFAGSDGRKAVGEVTPSYMYDATAIRRMAEIVPGARLFVVLREPISRAHSAYQLHADHYPGMGFWDACRKAEDYLVGWSLYADAMARLYEHFPREQVRVYLYEDIRQSAEGVLSDLFGFLGVDAAFAAPSAGKIYNRSVFPEAQKMLSRMRLGWSVALLKKTPLAEAVKDIHKSRESREDAGIRSTCPEDLRARFRDDVGRLEGIIGRDLSRWK